MLFLSPRNRSLQYIVQDGSTPGGQLLSGKAPSQSPIAKLTHIETSSGKTSAIHGLICVRPSELFFILQSMELSNISAAPLSAYSRELSQAITHMHTSDLLQRLHSELRLTPAGGAPSTTASAVDSMEDLHGTAGILDALKEAGIPFLDREVTFLLHISPHATYNAEFMHHFNDDSAVPAVSLPVKGLSGLSGSHGSASSSSFNSADHDLSALVTSESVEESQEAHTLASIRWLVQAARSALKSMYEHNNTSVVRNQSTVRELQELRTKLLARRDEIASILADWKKISTCMELCGNYKAQISLLLEKYKHHTKIAQQSSPSTVFWNSSGVSTSTSGSGGGSSSATGGAVEAAPSTVALLEASASMATAKATKDVEVQAALSKIVLLQLKLEGELQRSSSASSQRAEPSHFTSTASGARSASKLALLAANSPARAGADPLRRSPQQVSRTAWTADDLAVGMIRSRAPNPLHVVMQSVFASSSSPSSARK
jgi:hypothetical protein